NVSGISISGTDAANYTANTTASTTADITARALTVSAAGVNRAYDGTTDATVTLSDNRVAGDSLSSSYTGASFANKNAGTAKTVTVNGITISGTDAANYTANTTTTTTANITAKALTVTGITANDKVYSGTTAATLNAGGATLVGVVSGDTVTPNTVSTTGAFADKNVGTGKTVNVSGVALSGADATNYSVTQPTTTANITKATLTVMADNKTRTASASNPALTASYTNFVGGETLATSGVTGSPALSTTTTNVVGAYPISISAGTLSAGNYGFTFVDGVLTVTADAATKLLVLLPGETAAPGTATGKTGTPSAQATTTDVNVTVNAVDANWNAVNTVSDLIDISSSDATAILPSDATLLSGTAGFTLSFGTSGNYTVTASDLSDGSKTASTSPAITVSPAQFTPAIGGGAIPADGATGTFTSLSGPSYTENANGNVGTGTIILTAPSGFVFDTAGTAPTVLVTRLTGSGSSGNNINAVASGTALAMTSVTSTQLVFTVTSSSISGVTCKLTWQNVRVRPTAGTP